MGQSPFLLQGVPVTPLGGCAQLPPWQARLPSHVPPEQHAWESWPHDAALLLLPLLLPLAPLDAPLPLLAPLVEDAAEPEPPVEPVVVPGAPRTMGMAQLPALQTSPVSQTTPEQQGAPCDPQGGGVELEQAARAGASNQKYGRPRRIPAPSL